MCYLCGMTTKETRYRIDCYKGSKKIRSIMKTSNEEAQRLAQYLAEEHMSWMVSVTPTRHD